ncbi:MAG: type IX secretion system outer membrane channel protein PorV, partial [Bacteroidota bacterium]
PLKNLVMGLLKKIGLLATTIALCTLNSHHLHAQLSFDLNTITTAVPFLMITPESRGGGMGEVGVATEADANSLHWNAAKLAFAEKNVGISISYTPWLRSLVPDIDLAYLSFYKKITKNKRIDQAFSGSLRFFSLGEIQFTDAAGNNTVQIRPSEYQLTAGYARQLSDRWSGGLALSFINSNLTGGQNVGNADSSPGRSVAADISAYYQNDDVELWGLESTVAFGISIHNVGAKINYTNTDTRDFLPMNLRLGPRVTFNLDEYNTLTVAADINKLLVPTPPVFALDSNGQPIPDGNSFVIADGRDPNRSVASGLFGSFTDAPRGFSEELEEINWGIGAEYWYAKQFAARAGFFWEHANKGNRKFFTLGAGLRYNVFGLDFAFLIPARIGNSNLTQDSPLANTLRFTLTFDFEAFRNQDSEEPATN